MSIDVTFQNVQKNLYVLIECDQTHREKRGFVARVLSKKTEDFVRVQLQTGETGIILEIPSTETLKRWNFKFYNLFFHETIYLLKHRKTQAFIILPLKQKEGIEQSVLLYQDPTQCPITIQTDWYWKAIPAHRLLSDYFKKETVDFFILNGERKVTVETFKALEHQFKTLMP